LRAKSRDVDLVALAQASLIGHSELADRFDFVPEQFDPHRVVPVAGEDVQNAAADGELARQLDGAGIFETAGDEPRQEFVGVQPLADAQGARGGAQVVDWRDGLKQTLNAGNERGGGFGRRQLFQNAEALGLCLVENDFFAGFDFSRWKLSNRLIGEQRQIVGERFDVRRTGANDQHRHGGSAEDGRHGERASRSPGSVDRGLPSGL
jgi:hypothetical protein